MAQRMRPAKRRMKMTGSIKEKRVRTGFGYDVHRLTEGRKLILGGVEIPYEKGLLGHSDADVLLHALMDALLGAAALGDIGEHFPDTDDAYEGASSLELLRAVSKILFCHGFDPVNVDVTLVAQAPKISPYKEKMRENIAQALNLSLTDVSVKATTEEGLGMTGAGLGMKAYAVAVVTERIETC